MVNRLGDKPPVSTSAPWHMIRQGLTSNATVASGAASGPASEILGKRQNSQPKAERSRLCYTQVGVNSIPKYASVRGMTRDTLLGVATCFSLSAPACEPETIPVSLPSALPCLPSACSGSSGALSSALETRLNPFPLRP